MSKEEVLLKEVSSVVVLPVEPGEPNSPASKNAASKRFLVVFCVMLLNFSNTCQWIAYAPVGNYVNTYYGEGDASWFSVIYMLVTIPMGFIGMWMGSSAGLRFSFYSAATFNALGSIIRYASSVLSESQYHFHTALLGQSVSALAYPFIMFLPSTISAVWFPSDERTTATTLGVMANPLGVLIANFVVPLIVKSSRDVWILDIILCGICCLVAILIRVIVTENRPSCYSAYPAGGQLTYAENLRKCLTNGSYVFLLLALGGGIGMFNCLYTMMQEMTCPSGYENHIAGYCAMFMIISGIIGALIGGRIVDRFPQSCRAILFFAMTGAVFFGLLFLQLTRVAGMPWILGIVACFFGISGLAVYPIGLQMASETTYPAAPETASGLIVLMGQVLSVAFITIFKFFAEPMTKAQLEFSRQKCTLDENDTINLPNDYTVSIWIVSIIACTLPILMALIKPVNPRTHLEVQGQSAPPQSSESNDFPFKKAERISLVRPE